MLIVLLGIICVIMAGYIIIELKSIIVPFFLALIISIILNPIIIFFEKKHIPELISILIVLIATFFVMFLIGQLINLNIKSFIANINLYEARFRSIVNKAVELFSIARSETIGGTENTRFPALSAIIQNTSIKDIVTSIVGSISSILSDTFLVLIYLLFLLIGRDRLVKKMDLAFKSKTSARLKEVIKKVNSQVNKYIITKTLISLLTGVLVTLVLWAFGVEFAFIWGLLTFLLNFIPNIGSIIASLFPIIFALVQFEKIIVVFWIALCLFLIQFIVGNILEPKIVGQSMGISPLVVLISLIFWGYAWGIIGMILAVPLSVLLKIILENISGLKPLSILISDQK
jgi:AI-2 transport protein TqsA